MDSSSTDLEQELKRLNSDLAGQTRLAYQKWSAYHKGKSEFSLDERRSAENELKAIERTIANLETERDLVERAFKYETYVLEDEQLDSELADVANSQIAEILSQPENSLPEPAQHQMPRRQRISTNGRRRGRKPAAATTE